MAKRLKRRWYDITAYRYVPEYRLFDLNGEVLGLFEQDPVYYTVQGRAPYEEDGSVYMTPKQARKMVERSDYGNYKQYALAQDGPEVLDGDPGPQFDCPYCGAGVTLCSAVCPECQLEVPWELLVNDTPLDEPAPVRRKKRSTRKRKNKRGRTGRRTRTPSRAGDSQPSPSPTRVASGG